MISLPGYKILAIIPGKISRNKGRIFRYPQKIVLALAWSKFLAAKALCTITWKRMYNLKKTTEIHYSSPPLIMLPPSAMKSGLVWGVASLWWGQFSCILLFQSPKSSLTRRVAFGVKVLIRLDLYCNWIKHPQLTYL